MKKASEYRAHAEECRLLAARTVDPEHKGMLAKMGERWDGLANDREQYLVQQQRIAEKAIPEQTRAQLLALGIPAADHDSQSLAAYFPDEFNIGATGLNPEDLAKVLIYLTEKELISVPQKGVLTTVKKVNPGWHFCQFYRDFHQLLDMVAPYVAEGLKNNEGCFWVMPEAVTREAACHALSHHVEDVDDYLASGQLEMLSHPNWYLNQQGRFKSFEEISTALLVKQDQALARGFKFLRAAGDAGWVSGTDESKNFIDYEMKVNAALGATKVAAVCTYRTGVTADELIAIITAHQDPLCQVAAA